MKVVSVGLRAPMNLGGHLSLEDVCNSGSGCSESVIAVDDHGMFASGQFNISENLARSAIHTSCYAWNTGHLVVRLDIAVAATLNIHIDHCGDIKPDWHAAIGPCHTRCNGDALKRWICVILAQ